MPLTKHAYQRIIERHIFPNDWTINEIEQYTNKLCVYGCELQPNNTYKVYTPGITLIINKNMIIITLFRNKY